MTTFVAAFKYILGDGVTDEEIRRFLEEQGTQVNDPESLAGLVNHLFLGGKSIHAPKHAIDTCGTGGDKSGSFNISTAAALIVAAAGVPVAKHGNRALTSQSGSADFLEALKIPISLEGKAAEEFLREKNFVFMLAPLYYPQMKRVQTIRRQLAKVTIFNFLGPLLNPARVKHQVIGVFDSSKRRLVAETLKILGAEQAWVLTSEDGLDEISLSANTQVTEVTPQGLRDFSIDPQELGFAPSLLADLRGTSAQENAKIFLEILAVEKSGPILDAILINAAAAFCVADRVQDLEEGVALARKTIQSRQALEYVEKLISL